MNKYTWSITAMFTLSEPIDKSVVMAEYLVIASNEDTPPITALYEGVSQFKIPSDANNLTPYEELTEQQVLEWVQSEPNLVKNIESNLDSQIEHQITPPVTSSFTPLPWATE